MGLLGQMGDMYKLQKEAKKIKKELAKTHIFSEVNEVKVTVTAEQKIVSVEILNDEILSDKKKLEKVKPKNFDQLTLVKELVKEIACLSGELGVFKFEDNAFYYTGLARLFCQPEFQNTSLLQEFSQIVDDLDDSMSELLNSMGRDTQILMGEENFFGGSCSAILTRCNLPRSKDYGLIGILGPIRMNYNRNLALIESVKEIINEELIFED